MTDPSAIAAADQFLAGWPDVLTDAVATMRQVLADAPDEAIMIAALVGQMCNQCDEDPEMRARIAAGYVMLLRQMAKQP